MGDTGLEQASESSRNPQVSDQGGAESGELCAENQPIDPNLTVIIEAWPTLPEAIKAGILAMVRAAN
jgi:hypothetical protein